MKLDRYSEVRLTKVAPRSTEKDIQQYVKTLLKESWAHFMHYSLRGIKLYKFRIAFSILNSPWPRWLINIYLSSLKISFPSSSNIAASSSDNFAGRDPHLRYSHFIACVASSPSTIQVLPQLMHSIFTSSKGPTSGAHTPTFLDQHAGHFDVVRCSATTSSANISLMLFLFLSPFSFLVDISLFLFFKSWSWYSSRLIVNYHFSFSISLISWADQIQLWPHFIVLF